MTFAEKPREYLEMTVNALPTRTRTENFVSDSSNFGFVKFWLLFKIHRKEYL